MANTPDETNRKIQGEINKLSGDTKRNWQATFDTLKNSNASLDQMEALLERLKDLVESINGGLDYTSDIFKSILKELREDNKALQFQDTLVGNINKIARETLEIRKGETFADSSKIKSLQQGAQLQLDQLKSLRDSGILQGDQLDRINKQIAGLESVQNELNNISNNNEELNNGLTGAIPIISKLFGESTLFGGSMGKAYQTTMQLGQGAKAAGVEFDTLGTFTQAFGSQLKAALGPIAILLMIAEELKEVLKAADQGTGDLAKSFNITYDEANRLREELTEIASISGDVNVTTKGLQESLLAVNKTLGSNAMLNQQDLVFMTKMREMAGFTNEELVEMQKYTLATGGNLEDNTKNLMFAAKTTALNNGVLLNEKDIMRDISKTSDAIKLSIQGGAAGLGRAAAQAKALGMTLDQVDKIAGSLMDFESSINAELEAQLLTGRNINLEQARLYAINNDMEGLSREIAKNIGDASNFSKMNRLQQESVAKAVGMSREELAKTLTDQEALKNLSGKQAENAKAALAAARARGMSEEEIAQQGIDNLMKQQSVQERFNASVEKVKEIFVALAGPILDIVSPLADLVTAILPPILGLLKPVLGTLSSIAHVIGGIVRLITLDFSGAMESFGSAGTSFTKGVTGSTYFKMADVMSGGALSKATTTEIQDGQINPDGGLKVSGPKGTYSLDKNDTVIAGTNLNKPKGGDQFNDGNMVSELKEIKNILQKTYNLDVAQSSNNKSQNTSAGLDLLVDKLGTKTNVNTYKTQ